MSLLNDVSPALRVASRALGDESIPLPVRAAVADQLDAATRLLESPPTGGFGPTRASCDGERVLDRWLQSEPRCLAWFDQVAGHLTAAAVNLSEHNHRREAELLLEAAAVVSNRQGVAADVLGDGLLPNTWRDWWAQLPTPARWGIGLLVAAQAVELVGAIRD